VRGILPFSVRDRRDNPVLALTGQQDNAARRPTKRNILSVRSSRPPGHPVSLVSHSPAGNRWDAGPRSRGLPGTQQAPRSAAWAGGLPRGAPAGPVPDRGSRWPGWARGRAGRFGRRPRASVQRKPPERSTMGHGVEPRGTLAGILGGQAVRCEEARLSVQRSSGCLVRDEPPQDARNPCASGPRVETRGTPGWNAGTPRDRCRDREGPRGESGGTARRRGGMPGPRRGRV